MKVSRVIAALRKPISARIRVRWSTAVMAILFVGLGSLWLEVKTSPSTNTNRAINDVSRGLAPGESITITHNGTTTTTTTAPTSTTVQSPSEPAPPTSLAPTTTTAPSAPRDTAPTTTTGPHISPTTSSSVAGADTGTTSTTPVHQTTTSSPG
jgi:hypothetical protein